MKKTIIITEEQMKALSNAIRSNSENELPKKAGPYVVNPEKVLLVKKYLDTNFKRGEIENIGPDGYPQKTRIVGMLSSNGDILQNLRDTQLEDLLIDKFQNMFIDKVERGLFLHQVMNDWFNDKIGMFGNLSVNLLKEETSKNEINKKANEADPESASEAQIEAGNYKKGHIRIRGFEITIENPVGSKRYYNHGKKYNVMKNHYGYFTKSKGKDGDQVDVFLGPNLDNFDKVYVVDQKINGVFDESKVMFGFLTKKEAKAAYFANFDKNWHGFMHITGVSLQTFRNWLYRGRKQRQPFADYAMIQKKKLNEEFERSLEDIESDLVWEPVRNKRGEANLRNKETGELLTNEKLIWCGNMDNGIAVVRNFDGKYNYMRNDGTLLLDDWYDDCEEFRDGKGRVIHDEYSDEGRDIFYNYVDRNGEFLQDWELLD